MAEKLPDGHLGVDGRAAPGGTTNVLHVDTVNVHANDIDALGGLAAEDPDLAKVLLKHRDDADKRDHASFRLGIVASVLLVLGTLAALSYVLVHLGVVLSVIMIFVFIAIAFAMKVLLTGEWPETTWVGHLVKSLVTLTGGKDHDPDDE